MLMLLTTIALLHGFPAPAKGLSRYSGRLLISRQKLRHTNGYTKLLPKIMFCDTCVMSSIFIEIIREFFNWIVEANCMQYSNSIVFACAYLLDV